VETQAKERVTERLTRPAAARTPGLVGARQTEENERLQRTRDR